MEILLKKNNWIAAALCAAVCIVMFAPFSAFATVCGTGSNATFTDIGGGQCRAFLTSGTSFTVPTDWNSSNNTIEAIGPGSKGSNHTTTANSGCGGGGGGAYAAITNLSLTQGGSVSYVVALQNTGADTYFNGAASSSASVSAAGAKALGASNITVGAAGGLAANSTGTTKFNGGTGANQSSGNGGGGGGAAGPNGAGLTATTQNGAGGDNGSGGAGGLADSDGSNGTEYDATHGSGGGGGGSDGFANGVCGTAGFYGAGGGGGGGGNGIDPGTPGCQGRQGIIIITYAPPTPPTVTTSAASANNATSATFNGNVTATNGANATTCGFAWGTDSGLSGGDTATTTDSTCPSGTGAFTKGQVPLVARTMYYFRAYGTNTAGTGLGSILSFSLSRGSIAKPPNNLGLVAYWPFNEATSTSAADFSGNGNTGTLAGGTLPSWTTGKFGSALTFGAANNQVTISGPALSTTHSISMWVYPTAGPSGCASSICALFALAGSQGLVYTTGNVAQYLGGGAGPDVSSSALPLNTWSNIVVSVSAGGSTMYINGASVGTGSNVTAYTPNRIGGDTSFSQTFPGKVDEVRVYSRALSAAEALALYNQNRSGAARGNASSQTLQNGTTLGSGLKGLWTFDGGAMNWATSKAYDLSGNVITGTLNGITQSSVTIGKLGQALTFNGTTSYVNLGNAAALKSNACTVAAWVKTTTDNDGALFGATQSSTGTGYNIELGVNASAQVTNELVTVFDDTGKVVATTSANRSSVFDGGWHHIAVTESGSSSGTTIYIDGVSSGTTAPSGDTGRCTGQSGVIDTFHIGDEEVSAIQSVFYNGSIDDFRFYNRALSATEISQLYKLGKVLVKP